MRIIYALLFIFFSYTVHAQNKLPVVHANSKSALIFEEDNSVSRWSINPKLKTDIYITGKITKPKLVKFKTDIDSISLVIKPGKQENFIVLLNGKDSCFTRIQSPEKKNYSKLKPAIHDSIFFYINTYNTNLVHVVFNQTDSLILNFDTGATEVSLTTDALEKRVKSKPQLYNKFLEIKLGKRVYNSKVYDTQMVGNEADGLLGWNIFDGMIVELNYDKNLMILHSEMPKKIRNNPQVSKFNIRYMNNKPFIETSIIQGGIVNKDWFLFDLGYQSTVMLDSDLLAEGHFPAEEMKVIKKVILHGTKGNEVPVITASLDRLQLGAFNLQNVPAQVLGQSKPMPGKNVHILGNEILKRFNTFLDFQKNVIYLMPNSGYYLDYKTATKS
ncbi:hypothetical protein ACJVDH_11205 [Pedobacter sp. AW1-32]|uniref:hypothetical protein n=1 Tax=Pedobacter sp. AW1-32 TaxID=3383026 RepID=UPI003FEEE2A0